MPPEKINAPTPIQPETTKHIIFAERKIIWASLAVIFLIAGGLYSFWSQQPSLQTVHENVFVENPNSSAKMAACSGISTSSPVQFINKGKFYLESENWNWDLPHATDTAFTAILDGCGKESVFLKNSEHVYAPICGGNHGQGSEIEELNQFGRNTDANPQTFKPLGINYFTDGKHIYKNRDGGTCWASYEVVDTSDIDIPTFAELTPCDFAKDKNHVYYYNSNDSKLSVLENADINNFECIGANPFGAGTEYARDAHDIYYPVYDSTSYPHQKIPSNVSGFDPATFRIFVTNGRMSDYTLDKRGVYLLGKLIPNADSATFELLDTTAKYGEKYAKDKTSVFYGSNVVPSANPSDFHIYLPADSYGEFATDTQRVYFGTTTLPNADPVTFHNVSKLLFADKNYTWVGKKQRTDIDAVNLHRIGNSGFYSDGLHIFVFLNLVPVSGADAKSFTPYEGSYYSQFGHDNTHVYLFDEEIPTADPQTFAFYKDGGFEHDKNTVFYGTTTTDLDPDTFQISGPINQTDCCADHYVRDSKKIYFVPDVRNGVELHTLELIDSDPRTYDRYFK